MVYHSDCLTHGFLNRFIMDYFFVYCNHYFNQYFGYYYRNNVIVRDELTTKYINVHIENKFIKVTCDIDIVECYYYNIDSCKLFIDNYNNLMLSNLQDDYTFIIFDLSEEDIKIHYVIKDYKVLNKVLDKNIKTLDELFC